MAGKMEGKEFIRMMEFLGFIKKEDLGFTCFEHEKNNNLLLVEIENYSKTTFDISGFKVCIFFESKSYSKWVKGSFFDLAKYVLMEISKYINTGTKYNYLLSK